MRAQFIRKEFDYINKNFIFTYSYRGRTYEVIDYGWKGGEPLSWQHKNEQSAIDEEIERESKRNPDFVEENAQIGLDLFFSLYE